MGRPRAMLENCRDRCDCFWCSSPIGYTCRADRISGRSIGRGRARLLSGDAACHNIGTQLDAAGLLWPAYLRCPSTTCPGNASFATLLLVTLGCESSQRVKTVEGRVYVRFDWVRGRRSENLEQLGSHDRYDRLESSCHTTRAPRAVAADSSHVRNAQGLDA